MVPFKRSLSLKIVCKHRTANPKNHSILGAREGNVRVFGGSGSLFHHVQQRRCG